MQDARQVNGERGLLGYTGTHQGRPVSVQATGMGCPCAALSSALRMGDVVVGISAVPADRTAFNYTGGEPHAPTADFGLTHGIVHAAKGMEIRPHVGPIASSDTFYDPDPERHRRWAARGVLAVEMEAAVLFTISALRGVAAACVLVVCDLVGGEEFVRV